MNRPRKVSDFSYTLVDIYNESNPGIPYSEWKSYILEYYNIVFKDLIQGKYISLPYGMGIIYLKKYKPKKIPADRKESKKQKKFIPMLNLHTDGYQVKLKWDNRSVRVPNKNLYKIKWLRKRGRELSQMLFNGEVDIYNINS